MCVSVCVYAYTQKFYLYKTVSESQILLNLKLTFSLQELDFENSKIQRFSIFYIMYYI